jgi:hypothetical protein
MAEVINDGEGGCQLHAFDRNRYFYGKLLSVRDFETEQSYLNEKRQLINRLVLTSGGGIVCGLEVSQRGPQGIRITPGLALDSCGREMVISTDVVQANISELEGFPANLEADTILLLCLRYAENPREPVPALANASSCEEVCEYNRIREGFALVLQEPGQTPILDPFTLLMDTVTIFSSEALGLSIERTAPLWANPNEIVEVTLTVTTRDEGMAEVILTDTLDRFTPVEIAQEGEVQVVFPAATEGRRFGQTYLVQATSQPFSGGIRADTLRVGGEEQTLLDVFNVIDIIREPLSGNIVQRAFQERLNTCSEGTSDDYVCLAALFLTPRQGETTFQIDGISRVPLEQYVYNNPLLYELIASVDKRIGAQGAGAQAPTAPVSGQEIATGVVVFPDAQPAQTAFSDAINPGLGPGPIHVHLGLEEEPTGSLFMGPSDVATSFNAPQVLLGAVVDDPLSGQFRVGMRLQEEQAAAIRIRWWAFNPNIDKGEIIVGGGVVVVSVAPENVTLNTGSQQLFTATVTGTANKAVDWSVQEQGGGGIDTTGRYIAPQAVGTFHVIATSVADPSKSDISTVNVQAAPVVAVVIAPTTADLSTGAQQQFTATVTGTGNTQVTWSIQEGALGGSVNATGLYQAPTGSGTFHVVATSVADPSKSDRATVTVVAVAISVQPANVTHNVGETVQFAATVTGTDNNQVTWSVQEGANGGSISAIGRYTAPNTAGTFHVVATSAADPSKSDTATVTVRSVSISVSPSSATVNTRATRQFTATVTGTSDQRVTWSVREGTGGGSITTSGLYTAPGTAGTFHVVATSVADSRQTNEATVTVREVKGKDKDKEKEKEKDGKEKEIIHDKIVKEKDRKEFDNGGVIQPFFTGPVARLGEGPSNRLVENQSPAGQAFIRAAERPPIEGGRA